MRKTKLEKQIENQIEAAFKVHFNCVQINIMDITKIYKEAREAILGGLDLNETMINLKTKYEVKDKTK